MDDDSWYRRVWKILDAKGEAGFILASGNEFWLEPHPSNVDVAYYEVKFKPGMMNRVWAGTRLFRVGIQDPGIADRLPAWDASSGPVKRRYMDAAFDIASSGSAIAIRLEGVVNAEHAAEVARFYVLPGAIENGRDWIVVDVTDGSRVKQDGTAHGDPQ